MSIQERLDKATLFELITQKIRGESTEVLYKVSWVLTARREGLIGVQYVPWHGDKEVYKFLQGIAAFKPDGLLPKGLTGYYSIAPHTTIAIHELVDLVRDLKVIDVL